MSVAPSVSAAPSAESSEAPSTFPTASPSKSFVAYVQKVKIQHDQSSSEPLNIREVEVYDDIGTNQALNKPASQSSEYFSNISTKSFPASNAVDGNKNDDNFSHTKLNDENDKFCLAANMI